MLRLGIVRVRVRSQPSGIGGKQYSIATQVFQSQWSLQRSLRPHFIEKETGSEKGQGDIKP